MPEVDVGIIDDGDEISSQLPTLWGCTRRPPDMLSGRRCRRRFGPQLRGRSEAAVRAAGCARGVRLQPRSHRVARAKAGVTAAAKGTAVANLGSVTLPRLRMSSLKIYPIDIGCSYRLRLGW